MASLTLQEDAPAKASPQDQATGSYKHKTFFDLPSELRLKIYEDVLRFPDPIKLQTCYGGRLKSAMHGSKLPLHLFLVSKHLYLEASLFFYKRNKFQLPRSLFMITGIHPGQPLCKRLINLELLCGPASQWGYAKQCKELALLMPQLQRLELIFNDPDSSNMMIASEELSNAIATCASMFDGPQLRLSAWVTKKDLRLDQLEARHSNMRNGRSAETRVKTEKPFVALVQSEMPTLTLIQLTGEIENMCLRDLVRRTCLPGDCTWIQIKEEMNMDNMTGSRSGILKEFRWGKTDAAATAYRPEVDMLQWYPPLSDASLKILREFLAMYDNNAEGSCGGQQNPSDTLEAAQGDGDEVITEADSEADTEDNESDTRPYWRRRHPLCVADVLCPSGEGSQVRDEADQDDFLKTHFPIWYDFGGDVSIQNMQSGPRVRTNPIFPRENRPTSLQEDDEDNANDNRRRRPFFYHSDESDSDTTVVAESRYTLVENWLQNTQTAASNAEPQSSTTASVVSSQLADLSVSPGEENSEATTPAK